jgi:hypothetical protein
MPFLLERSLQLCLQTANRKDDELFRKVYFDLKEVGNELETLAVKVDKVPTLVDKIVSDSTKDLTQLAELSEALTETKEELALKLSNLEELATQEPKPPEPDPEIARAHQSITALGKSITNLSAQLAEISAQIEKLPTEFPAPIIQSVQETSEKGEGEHPPEKVDSKEKSSPDPSLEEILSEDAFSPDLPENETPDDPIEDLSETPSVQAKPTFEEPEDPIDVENPDEGSLNEQLEEDEEPPMEPTDDVFPEKGEDEDSESTEPKLEEETFDDLELEEPSLEESENDEEEDEPSEEVPVDEESPPLDEPAELDLGLPAPEETLRKVDALLAGESTAPPPVKEEDTPTKKAPGGMTTVIAKVMIGIGNKPYVRGEGPGLSWEEGVPMNFLEIGKWAWSPSRKNASVTIQIYRNDEDPDNTGKHEIKPGEKFELTPDFG